MNGETMGEHLNTGNYHEWWNRVSDHLGGVYPFQDAANPEVCSLDIGRVIQSRRGRGAPVELDPVALVCKSTMPYLLGDRTLIQGVRRAPWMAYPTEDGGWQAAELPPHGNERPEPEQFTTRLKEALIQEACDYVGTASTVGILLSGGMDSRIAAGVLREVQQQIGQPHQVVALTWGMEASRDVVYARKIAHRFSWDFQHFPLDAERLGENIVSAGRIGAEVSPLHLHAMPQIAQITGLDAVIAGSYGDSVGRAEFSGRKVADLKSILPNNLDRFGVVKRAFVERAIPALRQDVLGPGRLSGAENAVRRHEIEQEMHYMRRMLQSCTLTIAQQTPLYQMFTAPAVFGLMWGLDPAVRDDSWYVRLLQKLPGNLLEIPWARTGKRYDQPSGASDAFSRQHHAYGHWLRGELREEVLARVNSARIRGLGLFNARGLDMVLRAWERANTASTNSLDELVSWLASLYEFLEQYQIQIKGPLFASSPIDTLRAIRGGLHARLYIEARERMRD
jgi:hypothetical protein